MATWREAPKVYRDLSRAVGGVIEGAAKTAAVYGESRIKERLSGAVLNYRGGALRRSVSATIEPHAADVEIIFRAGSDKVPYAGIHERGGVIKAVRKPYLVFKTDAGWRRAKQVTIPKRPYLKPSAGESLVVLRRSVVQGLEKLR